MSKSKGKASAFPRKLEFNSEIYEEYRKYIKSRMGNNGLSLCGTHRMGYNNYWRERHKSEFKNCKIYLPKEWIPDEKFIDVMIDNQMIEGDNVILRPLEYDEEDEVIEDKEDPKAVVLILKCSR